MSEAKHKTWPEVFTRRQLNANAVLPVSDEQVEYAVQLKHDEIARKKAFEEAKWDIEYENLVKAANAKLN